MIYAIYCQGIITPSIALSFFKKENDKICYVDKCGNASSQSEKDLF